MSKFKAKNREEERASGISPEMQEIDTLLEELCDKEEEAKISLQLATKSKAFKKRRQQLKKCGSRQWKPWEKLKTGEQNIWSGSSKEKQKKYRRCYWILAKESRRDDVKKRRN